MGAIRKHVVCGCVVLATSPSTMLGKALTSIAPFTFTKVVKVRSLVAETGLMSMQ